MTEYNYLVDKYAYQTPRQIEEAKKEIEAISYMRANTDVTQVKNAYALYKKLNEKPSFHTEVGFEFMRELYEIIASSGIVEARNIPPIKIELENPFHLEPQMEEEEKKQRTTAAEKKLEKFQKKHKNLWVVNAFLIGIIAMMFYISSNSDYSFIVDYETKIIDKYSSWEEELSQREEAIREKEKELSRSE